jgi:hypothetical protein
MMHRILLFAHVLFAFLYMLAHGGSAAVAYRMRRETSAERVHALLDLSRSTKGAANAMLMAMMLCGIALGFLGHWWRARWIWLSIATLVALLVVMGGLAAPHFRRIRAAIDPAFVDGAGGRAARASSPDELSRALASGKPGAVTALAIGGWALILWMMLFKPF